MNRLNSTTRIFILQALSAPLFCQILQNHPGLCGDKERAQVVPAGLAVTINKTNAAATLHFGTGVAIALKGINDEIHDVCPLPSNKLVVFGFNFVGYEINITDSVQRDVSDSFPAYDPLMSPDQRWIAYRHFYPPQSEIRISEEYLLYNLQLDASANRHGPTPYTSNDVGWAMYPAYPGNAPADLRDVPEANAHQWRSKSFFWAPDSRSLVFADSVGNQLFLILVLIKNDKPLPYIHPVSVADVCGRPGGTNREIILNDASIEPISSDATAITAKFADPPPPGDQSCQPRQLNLSINDFELAKPEIYQPRKRMPSVGIPGKQPR